MHVTNNNNGLSPVPWFHETTSSNLWNEWTWTHIAWGILAYRETQQYLMPLVGHTIYEMIEGNIFPDPHRDVSNLNHIGDTIAFTFGLWLGEQITHGRR